METEPTLRALYNRYCLAALTVFAVLFTAEAFRVDSTPPAYTFVGPVFLLVALVVALVARRPLTRIEVQRRFGVVGVTPVVVALHLGTSNDAANVIAGFGYAICCYCVLFAAFQAKKPDTPLSV